MEKIQETYEEEARQEHFAQLEAKKKNRNIGTGNDDPEKMIYFYHPDHLGSTSYVTNLDGAVVQHVEYAPSGEVFIGGKE